MKKNTITVTTTPATKKVSTKKVILGGLGAGSLITAAVLGINAKRNVASVNETTEELSDVFKAYNIGDKSFIFIRLKEIASMLDAEECGEHYRSAADEFEKKLNCKRSMLFSRNSKVTALMNNYTSLVSLVTMHEMVKGLEDLPDYIEVEEIESALDLYEEYKDLIRGILDDLYDPDAAWMHLDDTSDIAERILEFKHKYDSDVAVSSETDKPEVEVPTSEEPATELPQEVVEFAEKLAEDVVTAVEKEIQPENSSDLDFVKSVETDIMNAIAVYNTQQFSWVHSSLSRFIEKANKTSSLINEMIDSDSIDKSIIGNRVKSDCGYLVRATRSIINSYRKKASALKDEQKELLISSINEKLKRIDGVDDGSYTEVLKESADIIKALQNLIKSFNTSNEAIEEK